MSGATGRTADLGGPVHYVDYGGPSGGPGGPGGPGSIGGAADHAPVVLVHGLGGSHLNWDLLAPLLTPHGRVLAIDLPGFGRSEPGGRRAGVPANVAVLGRFLDEVVGEPVVLAGNSMGGMISIFTAGERPASVRGLVLVDPAIPGPRRALDPFIAAMFAAYAVPLVGERFLRNRRTRQSTVARVRETLSMVGVDPDALPPEVIERSVTLLDERQDVEGMDRAFLAAARSLLRVLADPRRYRRAMAGLTAPVLLLHGDRDRLVPVAAARQAARRHPRWRYVELAGAGHVPQLQVPDRVAAEIVRWLTEVVQRPGMSRPSMSRRASRPE